LNEVQNNPQWIFIFLTKNPRRLVGVEWPSNAWVGITVDIQARVKPAIEIFKKIKATVKFVSCEPFLERLTFPSMPFDWILMGAQSQTAVVPEFQPEWKWVHELEKQARENGVAVFMKPNLTVRPKEYPKKVEK